MKNITNNTHSTATKQVSKILSLVVISLMLMSGTPLMASEIVPGEQAKITGKVSDAFTGKPIANVSVSVKGFKNPPVKTNEEGVFNLVLPKKAIMLIFTVKGYQTLEVPIAKKTTFEIEMSVAESSPSLWQ